ncbi:alpha/beta hydrolase [Plastoroseomonas arctica]|uniref:Alpha/beta hydrolase n=1 Tax=Plastoroseomonas arctica TaxID=1509237 RepID=A0AAF1JVI6_9PROT|nr:alpha/beta hydrolase [Plastoroseomonas arctica]MBR0653708.1 alpha/beta hydrolase [Plastoroseomonas arctica]
MSEESGSLERIPGVALAWRRRRGQGPGVVFLGGFRSDMTGSKAQALDGFCAARGTPFLRLDYSGHGASGGRFEDGCIGEWRADAAHLIAHLTEGPQILIGSSMGGWIALLLARRSPPRALIGIAPAPDFTEALMWPAFSEAQRATILRDGVLHIPSGYGPPTPITRRLIEDGRENLVLQTPLVLACPVRLLQGIADPDVPWRHAIRLAEHLDAPDLRLTLIKDGDHRLSRPQDLSLLEDTLAALLAQDAGEPLAP